MTAKVIGKRHYCITLAVLALASAAWAVSPDIVISQVFGGGGNSGALLKNDFIELFNRGTTSVDITGWSVQYGSATGVVGQSTTFVTTLSGTIPAGGYYLIQEAAGSGGSVDLPTPDATGSLAMGGSAGKVALANNSTPLNVACPSGGSLVDFVGYGTTANCFEGTTYAPATSSILADFRAQNGCQDTDQNGTDFAAATPNPRNSATTPAPCTAPPLGACCNYGTNTCTVVAEASCTGTWLGANTTCASNSCAFPTGRCCLPTGACKVENAQDCTTDGGTWTSGGNCDCPNPCISDSNILAAKLAGNGKYVRLANVIVTSTTDLISSTSSMCLQIQDSTAGITVYGPNDQILGLGFNVGDKVTVEGLTSTYNGLFELGVPFTCVVNSGQDPNGVPAPKIVTSTDFADASPTAEGYESELVKAKCVTFSTTGNFAGTTNYTVTDPSGSFVVRVSTGALDLVGTAIPTTPQNVTGIFSQNDPNDPRDGVYQLLVRSLADFEAADPNCTPTGACCNGATCTIMSQAQCAAASGAYEGDGTSCTPNPCIGACCVGASCTLLTEGDCATGSGTFHGYGTVCTPNPCVGACCVAGVCTDSQLEADCTAANGSYLGDASYCATAVCPVPVESGDIALGLSTSSAFTTAEQVRAGAKIGSWTSQPYLQSMEFDNVGGTLHSAAGNLLALNYGSGSPPDCSDPNQGGRLYSMATSGSNASQKIFDMGEPGRTILAGECSRLSGLSVSSGNQYVAMWGSDTLKLYVLAYTAGATPGTGAGASITDGWAHIPTTSVAAGSQGTAWFDNDTVLLYTIQIGTGLTDLSTVDFDGTTFTQTARLAIDVGVLPVSAFSSVAYNPSVSPYVFCLFSARASGVTTNKLSAVDPSTWTLVNKIDLSDPNTLQTAREIALGPDGYLYIAQYHSGTNVPYIDRINAADPASWTDNSCTDYYAGSTYSSYNGLDVAFAPPTGGACCVNYVCSIMSSTDCTAASGSYKGDGTTCTADICACRGDASCDGLISYADINPFVQAIGNLSAWQAAHPTCPWQNCDVNADGVVSYADINPFVQKVGSPGPCP